MNFTSRTGIKVSVVVVALGAGSIVAERHLAASPSPVNSRKADSPPRVEVVRPRRVDPAIVKPSGFDGEPFAGTVTRFSLRLDPETRNMRTEIDLSNPDERLYPGMYAEVSLQMNRRPDVLTVPAAAVGSDGDGNFVYTITDNRITRLAIKIGLTDNGRVEVTAGLPEETPVVATIKGVPPPGTAIQSLMVSENQ
jgi:multidrug efflux pump subunit AcrA (membrane-fusion protein)